MAFWSLESWQAVAQSRPIVSGFDEAHFGDGCYRLALGREAIVSVQANATSGVRRNIEADGDLQLLPGQFAYLITHERVCVPVEAVGLINIATKVKLAGIVNVSGFHVDPGYEGRLIFTIFNAGAQAVHIGYGERIFRLWLNSYEGRVTSKPPGYETIPHDWANGLVGAYPSPFVVEQNLEALRQNIDKRLETIVEDVRNLRSQRSQFILGMIVVALFLLPFVAGFYANVISSAIRGSVTGFEWLQNLFQ